MERLRLGHAFRYSRFWNEVPGVFREVTLFTQLMETDQSL